MLAAARTGAPLVQADALRLPVPDGRVDGVTCGFALRNFVELGPFLTELGRVARPGGRIALLEVAEPANPVLRTGHGVYFGHVVPRIGGLLSDGDAYRYLPKSVAYLPPTSELMALVRDAGFPDATRTTLSGGISQLIVGTRAQLTGPAAHARRPDPTPRRRRRPARRSRAPTAGSSSAAVPAWPAAGSRPRVTVDRVDEVLAAIAVDDEVGRPGCGPIAFGALPFHPDRGAELVVPSLVVGTDGEGTRWITTVGAEPEAPPVPAELAAPANPHPLPSHFDVRTVQDPADWCAAVAEATTRIRAGALDKVVLAREVVVTTDVALRVDEIVARLRVAFAGCYVFSIDGMVGASPELLVSRHGRPRARPAHGGHRTARRRPPVRRPARGGAPGLPHLPPRAPGHHRHGPRHAAPVLLLPRRRGRALGGGPAQRVAPRHPRRGAAVAPRRHRCSSWPGRCTPPRPCAAVPATRPGRRSTSSSPRRAIATPALVGWVDGHGNGTWAVGIRCAQVEGNVARLHGGCGIVADSDPPTELAESRAKLQAVLGAIVRP